MKLELQFPHEKVNTAVIDTVRIVDQYRLDRKQYDGYNRIWGTGIYYDFSVLGHGVSSTTLEIIPYKKGEQLHEIFEEEAVNGFMSNLNRILNGDVMVTADILNKDPFKQSNRISLVNSFSILLAVIVLTYYGIKLMTM